MSRFDEWMEDDERPLPGTGCALAFVVAVVIAVLTLVVIGAQR